MTRKELWRKGMTWLLTAAMTVMPFQSAAALDSTKEYNAGTYTGTASDFNGDTTTVTVTLEDNSGTIKIADILTDRDFANSTDRSTYFWTQAQAVVDQIKANNGTEGVDVVTGATYSSRAILNAVKDAVSKAEKENTPAVDSGIFDGGDGSEEMPYEIAGKETLLAFAASVNDNTNPETYEGKYIKVTKDIDLTGTEWTPIGDSMSASFAGNFDGGNYTIKGLTMGSETSPKAANFAGFFAYASGDAVLKNIKLDGVAIHIVADNTAMAGAILASGDYTYDELDNATNGTMIDHCYASGTISVKQTGSMKKINAGGIAGMLNQYNVVSNSGSSVKLLINNPDEVQIGGLVGSGSVGDLLINDYSVGDIVVKTASTWGYIGGFSGYLMKGAVYNSYQSGTISVTQEDGSSISASTSGFIGYAMREYISTVFYKAINTTDAGVAFDVGCGLDGSTVQNITATKLKDEDFVKELGSNIGAIKVSGFFDKLSSYNDSLAERFQFSVDLMKAKAGTQFYDWTYDAAAGHPVHTDSYYVPKEIDASIFTSGDGTESNPYLITTKAQMFDFAESVNDNITYEGKYVALGNAIDLENDAWTPVGKGTGEFDGIFDGKGYPITNLSIGTAAAPYEDKGTMNYGLFGILGTGAEVKNLILDAAIYVTSAATVYVGGIAGANNRGLIENVTVNGTIVAKSDGIDEMYANNFAGGVAGVMRTNAKVVNAQSTADCRVETTGGIGECGGIVGMLNRGLVANSYATGKISGTASRSLEGMPALGGIAGLQAGTVVNCYTASDVISDCYSQYIGALAGWATGIAETYQSYFSLGADVESTKNDTSDEKVKMDPVVAIGWEVGPGVSDEGDAYTGSFSLHVEGLSVADFTAANLVTKLNDNLTKLNADLVTGGRDVYYGTWTGSTALAKSLREWQLSGSLAVPTGAAKESVYDKETTEAAIAEVLKKAQGMMPIGTFYGRDAGKNKIVKIVVGESENIVSAELVGETPSEEESAALALLVSEGVTDNIPAGSLKDAMEEAIKKSRSGDTTGYGAVDARIFDGGTGTKADPYQIATEEQLIAFAASINEDEHYENADGQDQYVVLTNNITLTQEWIPAGGQGSVPHFFAGSFDGQNHEIKHLRIGSTDAPRNYRYGGMFASLSGASVKNLFLENVEIHMEDTATKRMYIGTLAAAAAGRDYNTHIDRITVSGSIDAHGNSDPVYVGGLAGAITAGTTANVETDVDINAVSDASWIYGGGISGLPSFCMLVNNITKGRITADASPNKASIGGIAGFNACVTINSVASVDLSSKNTTTDVGGLAGRNTGVGYIADCYYDETKLQKNGNVTVSTEDKIPYGMTVNTAVYGIKTIAAMGKDNLLNALNAENLSSDAVNYQNAKDWYTGWEDCLIPADLSFDTFVEKNGVYTFGRQKEATVIPTAAPTTSPTAVPNVRVISNIPLAAATPSAQPGAPSSAGPAATPSVTAQPVNVPSASVQPAEAADQTAEPAAAPAETQETTEESTDTTDTGNSVQVSKKSVSVAPGKSSVISINLTGTGKLKVSVSGTGVKATIEGDQLKIRVTKKAVMGKTVTVTVKKGSESVKIKVKVPKQISLKKGKSGTYYAYVSGTASALKKMTKKTLKKSYNDKNVKVTVKKVSKGVVTFQVKALKKKSGKIKFSYNKNTCTVKLTVN